MNADTTRLRTEPVPVGALALSDEIRAGRMKDVAAASRGKWRIEAKLGQDSLWLFVRGSDEQAFAVRTAWSPGGGTRRPPGWAR